MQPEENLDLGHGLHLRVLARDDATLLQAHRSLGIARIWLEINPGNEPSLRVAQRAGYRFEQLCPGTAATGPARMPNTTHGTTASSGPT